MTDTDRKKSHRYRGNGLDYRGLRKMQDDKTIGPAGCLLEVQEAFARGDVKPEELRLLPLFEAVVPEGPELYREWRTGGFSETTYELLEDGAVKRTTFAPIVREAVYTKVLEGYQSEEFVFKQEADTFQSSTIGMEKIAGVSEIGDEAEIVPEGGEYPLAGMGPDWIHAPEAYKRGFRVALTWEVVFDDKTGQLLKRAGNGGYWMGYNEEIEVIDAFVDENAGATSQLVGGHRYHWRDTSYATHQTSTPWINVKTSNALVDWTDLDAAEQVANALTDPNTGAPILVELNQIVVVKALEKTARYIVHSMEVQINPTGYATSGVTTRYGGAENFYKNLQIVTSRLLATRTATDTDWWLANIKKTVALKVIRPLEVIPAPANHPDNFNRDIVQQWRASRFTKAFVQDPRYTIESRA